MKAQAKSVDFLCIVMVILILLFFFTVIFPNFLDIVLDELVGTSAEVLARQSSGLITLLGAATHDAQLSYKYSEEVTYDITIDKRVIKISPYYTTEFAEKMSYAIGVGIEMGTKTIENTHGIKVIKKGSVYEVESYG